VGDAPSVVSIHTTPRRAWDGVDKPRLGASTSVPMGRRRRNMSETPARYCGNCGNELDPEDRFCQNCRRPVHQTAQVPTPEADVPVPPPPQQEAATQPLEQAEAQPREPWTTRQLALGCLGVFFVVFVVGAFLAALAGNGGGNEAQKNKKSGGGKDTAPSQSLL
jgi:hypothetical protein